MTDGTWVHDVRDRPKSGATSISATSKYSVKLSAEQRALLASQMQLPNRVFQNMAVLIRFENAIDPEKLARSFDQVVEHSDVLRTVVEDGRASVLVGAPEPTKFIDIDATNLAPWTRARAKRSFDLSLGGYESIILRAEHGAIGWFLNFHHILLDAQGLANLIDAVAQTYQNGSQPEISQYYGVQNEPEPQDAISKTERSLSAPSMFYSGSKSPAPAAGRVALNWSTEDQVYFDNFISKQGLFSTIARSSALIAAAAVLTHRVTGRAESIIGLVTRRASGGIGPKVKVLPITVSIPRGATYGTVFQNALTALTAALKGSENETAPSPDYPMVVNMLPESSVPTVFAGIPIAVEWIDTESIPPEHSMRLHETWFRSNIDDDVPRLELDLQHSVAAAPRHPVVGDHLASSLRLITQSPDVRVAETSLCTPHELVQLSGWEKAEQPQESGASLALQIEASLKGHDRVVVEDEAGQVTGDQLWRWSVAIAADLTGQQRVGIALPPSVEALATIYGAVLAGCSFVPLDPEISDSSMAKMVNRANLRTVYSSVNQVQAIRNRKATVHNVVPQPEKEAYLLFTSGSTGQPKGVPISYHGLEQYLDYATSSYFDSARPPVAAFFGAITSDLTLTTVFAPILAGGRLFVLGADGAKAMKSLAQKPNINWCKATPSHLRILANRIGSDHSLKMAIVGGEAFSWQLARTLQKILPALCIVNEYGPTETVVGCVTHRVKPETSEPGSINVPIGRPLPGTRVRVCDEYDQPVPIGVAGELLISTSGAMRRYLDDDEVDPFSTQENVRFYRSGDLVRWRDDGLLEYLGRVDKQLTVGGKRLEPVEIEAALTAHPQISSAFVGRWSPTVQAPKKYCLRCGLSDATPGSDLDSDQICAACKKYDKIAPVVDSWFGTSKDLTSILADARKEDLAQFDCVHLLSGGKDSVYALYRLIDLGFRPFALTLDNGFISESAKENIRRVVADLAVPHEFAKPSHMGTIFRESLDRHSNVCHGCFKTIYTLGLNKALEVAAPLVTTGLSRGQLFETRFAPGQFSPDRFDPVAIDAAVDQARRLYHRVNDTVRQTLACGAILDGSALDRITFVDFFRYEDVALSDMLDYLNSRTPWRRPKDTGRSSNCLINAAGIHIHLKERGFHNYAVPYAWDVRLGHKSRQEAIEELNDDFDLGEVNSMLHDVGYEAQDRSLIVAWLTLEDWTARRPTPTEIRSHLGKYLPVYALPSAFVFVDDLPMNANGKIDSSALPAPQLIHRQSQEPPLVDLTETEGTVIAEWERVLSIEPVGPEDDFFALGGDSLQAMECVLAISTRFKTKLPDNLIFLTRTPRAMSTEIDQLLRMAQIMPNAPTSKAPPIITIPRTEAPPLTVSEEALLLDQRARPSRLMYNVCQVFRVQNQLDSDRFTRALTSVATLHEPLIWSYGSPRKKMPIEDALRIQVSMEKVSVDALQVLTKSLQRLPFDLKVGPSLRVLFQPLDTGETAIVLVSHHIRCDHASFDLLWQQIVNVYEGNPPLTQLPSYSDVATWQAADDNDDARDFWLSKAGVFAGALRIHDDISAQSDGYLDSTCEFSPSDLKAAVSATPVASLLAGITAGISAWFKDNTVEVALVSSARIHPDAQQLFGYFLNPLPMSFEIAENETVLDLANRTSLELGEVLAFRNYPLREIVQDRKAAGHAATIPRVLVSYDDRRNGTIDGGRVESWIEPNDDAVTDLSFFLQVHADRVTLGLEYAGSVGSSTALAILKQCQHALRDVVLGRPTRVCDITEKAQNILQGAVLANAPLMLERFEKTLTESPDAICVRCGTVEKTRAEIDQTSRAIAETLIAAGVQRGETVLLHLERSVEMVAAILGILRAGAAYVPVDVNYPNARIETIANQASVKHVLTHQPGPGFSVGTTVITPDIFADKVIGVDLPDLGGEDIAYVMFTSGSTGTPRGVAISHRQLAQSTAARDLTYPVKPDSFAMLSSPAFDSSIVGLFWPLVTGATICLPTEREAHDIDAMAAMVSDCRSSHLLCVPTLYRALLSRRNRNEHWVNHAILAGEPCPRDVVQEHFSQCPDSGLTNEYGPTEATVWATSQLLTASDPDISIGWPVPGTWASIIDGSGRPCPPGVAGTLILGGPNVVSGYFGENATEGSRFESAAQHPVFGAYGGTHFFVTGDSAVLENGRIQFLGREDDQISIGGTRIEPVELEQLLIATQQVKDVVIVAQDMRSMEQLMHDAGPKQIANTMTMAANSADPSRALEQALRGKDPAALTLVAHIVLAPGTDAPEIRSLVNELMPPLMRPKHFGFHNNLPYNANGKLDRRAAQLLPVETAYIDAKPNIENVPADALTRRLAETFAKILGRPEFPFEGSFFDEGGDSLAALRLLVELEKTENAQLPTSILYDAPSPKLLANHLRPRNIDQNSVPIFVLPCDAGFTAPTASFHADISRTRKVIYLEHPCLRSQKKPIWSLHELATAFADKIEESQPNGPLLVGAFCIAAHVASEMNQILQARGRHIQHLLLFDPSVPLRQVERLRLRQGLPSHLALIKDNANTARILNGFEFFFFGRKRAIRRPSRTSKFLRAVLSASSFVRRTRNSAVGGQNYMHPWPRGVFLAATYEDELVVYDAQVSILASEEVAKKYYETYPEFLDHYYPKRNLIYVEKTHYALGVTQRSAKLAHDCFEAAMLEYRPGIENDADEADLR